MWYDALAPLEIAYLSKISSSFKSKIFYQVRETGK